MMISFGVLKIPYIHLGRRVDAGPKPTYAEKLRVPPPPPWGPSLAYLTINATKTIALSNSHRIKTEVLEVMSYNYK